MPEQLVVLGKIVSVHGIKGDVKIYSFTDPIDNILQYKEWILCRDSERLTIKLKQGRIQGRVLVVSLDGVTDRDQASTYVGFEVLVHQSELPVLQDDEYYWHQLQGLKVINQEKQLLGVVDYLLETGANDVLIVKPCEGSLDSTERLLPYTDQCVLSIDLDLNEIQVDWDAAF